MATLCHPLPSSAIPGHPLPSPANPARVAACGRRVGAPPRPRKTSPAALPATRRHLKIAYDLLGPTGGKPMVLQPEELRVLRRPLLRKPPVGEPVRLAPMARRPGAEAAAQAPAPKWRGDVSDLRLRRGVGTDKLLLTEHGRAAQTRPRGLPP